MAYVGLVVMVEVMKAHESAVISANRFTTVRLMSGVSKRRERCGPCWCRNVDSCRYGNCHGPNLDPN